MSAAQKLIAVALATLHDPEGTLTFTLRTALEQGLRRARRWLAPASGDDDRS